MARDSQTVMSFLELMATGLQTKLQEDLESLGRKKIEKEGSIGDKGIEQHDVAFYTDTVSLKRREGLVFSIRNEFPGFLFGF
jgi:Zn-dependent oligopeptidase